MFVILLLYFVILIIIIIIIIIIIMDRHPVLSYVESYKSLGHQEVKMCLAPSISVLGHMWTWTFLFVLACTSTHCWLSHQNWGTLLIKVKQKLIRMYRHAIRYMRSKRGGSIQIFKSRTLTVEKEREILKNLAKNIMTRPTGLLEDKDKWIDSSYN